MRYLIDTNIWIFYLKNPQSRVRERLELESPSDIAVDSIVWGELLHGARKYGDPIAREQRVTRTLAPFVCLSFDLSAAREYARVRDELEIRGEMIGNNDLMIASIALVHNLTLVTNNVAEFSRVGGLRLEDWSV